MFVKAGERYGRLVVREVVPGARRGYDATCDCDCGNTTQVSIYALRRPENATRSCGCYRRERIVETQTTHDLTRSAEYAVWNMMRQRCANPESKTYPNYGERGIRVCERWQEFAAFYEDMGPRPTSAHSIERIDNDGDYAPSNCRWATRSEQMNNMRSNIRVEWAGREMTLKQLSRFAGVPYPRLYYRVSHGWNLHDAVTKQSRGQVKWQ